MRRSTIALFAVVSAAGIGGVAWTGSAATAGASAAPGCWTVPAVVREADSGWGLWTYTHTVSWCGDRVAVTSTVSPRISGTTIDGTCVYQGVKTQRVDPAGRSWRTMSMGEFACTDDLGRTQQVNPWAIVTAYPDGKQQTETGIAVSASPDAEAS